MANFGDFSTINNIVAIILGIIGLIWLIYGIWRNRKINQIRSWPKTNAVVLNAVAEPANASAGNTYIDPRYIVATVNSPAQYIPIIIYRYNVGGKEFRSNNVVFSGPRSYNALDIKTIMGQIYPGSVIPVFYNPNNPAESYIYNGSPSYLQIIIGIILLLIAAYLAYHNHSQKKYTLTKTTTRTRTMEPNSPVLTTEGNVITTRNVTANTNRRSTTNFYKRNIY